MGPEMLQFLAELAMHNDRDWFKTHKQRFETQVMEPTLALVSGLAPGLAKLSPHFQAVPKRSGGSLLRIHRDVRFSKDKTPYNPYMRARFFHARAGKDGPCYYFHIGPEKTGIALGIWHPESKKLARIRAAIDKRPKDWKKVRTAAFKKTFGELGGESLKRPPKGYAADHPLIEDLKRKDFAGLAEWEPEAALAKDFPKKVLRAWKAGTGLMRFVCEALELEF